MHLPATQTIANFDSAAAMLRALARFLHGKDFPGLGIAGGFPEPLALLINRLPRWAREQIYIWSGWSEAITPDELPQVSGEAVARWAVSEYPRRRYPAVAVGSSGGALIHLCAALGAPWLPQTFLVPVKRSGVTPGDMIGDMEWGVKPGQALLRANPDLQLHHMHDANQDRLMVQRMTYFRVKFLRLPAAYERFLQEHLEPGGTILVSECRLNWPTVRVADRHIFQPGAVGGATPDEYLHGGPRVDEYLARYHAPRESWAAPAPDGERPEAEWEFEPALRDDLERLARRLGCRLCRLAVADPELLSPPVADLYRWWHRQNGADANRLMVGSFILMEPWWALHAGAAPYWMTFNTSPCADRLSRYLDVADPFDEIYMMLFSHGVDSVGLVPIERWRSLLRRARRRGDFLGVDERAYPRDFATFVRYHNDVRRKMTPRPAPPRPLTLEEWEDFLAANRGRYEVEWVDSRAPARAAG